MKTFIKPLVIIVTIASLITLLRRQSNIRYTNELTRPWNTPNTLIPREFLSNERNYLLSRPDEIAGWNRGYKEPLYGMTVIKREYNPPGNNTLGWLSNSKYLCDVLCGSLYDVPMEFENNKDGGCNGASKL